MTESSKHFYFELIVCLQLSVNSETEDVIITALIQTRDHNALVHLASDWLRTPEVVKVNVHPLNCIIYVCIIRIKYFENVSSFYLAARQSPIV